MKKKIFYLFAVVLSLIVAIYLQFTEISLIGDEIDDGYIKSIILYAVYVFLTAAVLRYCNYNVFRRPRRVLCFFIAMIVAVNNFPFSPFIKGDSAFYNVNFGRTFLFVCNCFFTAAFEELFFRGVLFNFFVDCKACDKRGIIKAIIFSSLIFGAAHLLNLFGGAGFLPTLLQAGYTSLVGALCAYTLFKTRNIIFPWLVHAVYNVCGLILTSDALGSGVSLDIATLVITVVLGVAVGVYVLTSLIKTTEEECADYRASVLNKKS